MWQTDEVTYLCFAWAIYSWPISVLLGIDELHACMAELSNETHLKSSSYVQKDDITCKMTIRTPSTPFCLEKLLFVVDLLLD